MSAGFYDGNRRPEADHDPQKQIQWEIQRLAKAVGTDITAVIMQFVDASKEAIEEQIKEIIDTLIGYSTDPLSMLEDLAAWVATVGAGGEVDFIPDWIPLSSLVEGGVNLLIQGLFQTAASIAEGDIWGWTDAFKTGDALGSATVPHDGSLLQLFSKPPIKVTQGQKLTLNQSVRWEGLSAITGPAFELGLQYLNAAQQPIGGVTTIANILNPALNSAAHPGVDPNGFVPMSASTVIPAGVSFVRQVLQVNPVVGTGQSWWSNSKFEKISLPSIFTGFLDAGGFLTEFFDASRIGNIADIPPISPLSVLGLTGGTIADTFQTTIDRLWSGFARAQGTLKSIADVQAQASDTTATAQTSLEVGEWNNAILGIRDNNSYGSGQNKTAKSPFSRPAATAAGGDPPFMNVSAATVPLMFWLAEDDAKRGRYQFCARVSGTVTAFYIDVYRVTPAGLEFIVTSNDLFPQLAAGWRNVVYDMPSANRPTLAHGDELAFGYRVQGTGSVQVVCRYDSWYPPDTTALVQRPSATRSNAVPSGTLAWGNVTWAGDTPWGAFAILEGDAAPPYYAPRQTIYSTVGTHVYNIPTWANFVDVVLLGPGGGGKGGNGGDTRPGYGGGAGQWVTETLVRGVDFPVNATQIIIDVTAGGQGGAKEQNGKTSTPVIRRAITGGKAAIQAAAGLGATAYGSGTDPMSTGREPGDINYQGFPYVGGDGGTGGRPGGNGGPGAGGGGGYGGIYTVAYAGGDGGGGRAVVTARQS
ncbi:minor tail protein [Mycobacterium phage NoShow]|nr:minor tail protein [Mycobacterium phage NoShow]